MSIPLDLPLRPTHPFVGPPTRHTFGPFLSQSSSSLTTVHSFRRLPSPFYSYPLPNDLNCYLLMTTGTDFVKPVSLPPILENLTQNDSHPFCLNFCHSCLGKIFLKTRSQLNESFFSQNDIFTRLTQKPRRPTATLSLLSYKHTTTLTRSSLGLSNPLNECQCAVTYCLYSSGSTSIGSV